MKKLIQALTKSIANRRHLRRWRRSIREGDKVCIAKVHEVDVRVLSGNEVTIWDSMIREYETYKLNELYPTSCK